MPHELDKILISALSGSDWHAKIREIHDKVKRATYFEDGSDEDERLNEILRMVKKGKEKAVAEYTKQFDDVTLTPEQFLVSKEDLKKAHKEIDKKLLKSIQQAIKNVRKYQEEIFIGNSKHPGIKYTPIERVGICVPGASAPLPSTVIMTAVPAQVAGVREIAVVSPPRHEGSIHPVILAVCCQLGIDEVYRIGGAQAVAALAIGTDTIGKVDKIVPHWLDAGINCVYPNEVAAANDVIAMRGKFGRDLLLIGGIDKRALAQGKVAIQEELGRRLPLVAQGGYMPAVDHSVPPDISFEDYAYYSEYQAEECARYLEQWAGV